MSRKINDDIKDFIEDQELQQNPYKYIGKGKIQPMYEFKGNPVPYAIFEMGVGVIFVVVGVYIILQDMLNARWDIIWENVKFSTIILPLLLLILPGAGLIALGVRLLIIAHNRRKAMRKMAEEKWRKRTRRRR